ncbi:MAG: aspartate kinase [Bacteroidota bacterium]
MKVFKFGGASVKDAAAVKNMCGIIGLFANESQVLVVVSAMGKSTNNLEALYAAYRKGGDYTSHLQELRKYHENIVNELSPEGDDYINLLLNRQFDKLLALLEAQNSAGSYDEGYDQIISFGEIISTYIVSWYLEKSGVKALWADARNFVQTDNTWREGQVDWAWTEQIIRRQIVPQLQTGVVVTQGFIGGTVDNKTTTLGREGSDYTAAIFAHCLGAESLTIWKDVPGIMNADPKRVASAVLFSELNYSDAAEMTYFGATVIHSKTIRPLANRNIPLYVRSFIKPEEPGTQISNTAIGQTLPAIIFKDRQRLVSFHTRDFAFIADTDLISILENVRRLNLKINLMQNSALSVSLAVDENPDKLEALTAALSAKYDIKYNSQLCLLTVKNYNPDTITELTGTREVLLEQKTRNTWQGLVKE